MNLVEYAKSELSRLEKNDKDGEQKATNKSILEIIEVFDKQGFSGFSAGYKEDVPPGFTGDEYDIITDNPERIKALYERKRKEFDEALGRKGIIRKSSEKPWGEGE